MDQHDRPNLERSPDEHDAEAIMPGSTDADVAAIEAALDEFGVPAGPLLDIGCGTGRHCRALAARGHQIEGIDLDPRMIEAAQAADPRCQSTYAIGDGSCLDHHGPGLAAALLLNRSLVCFHSHRQAWGLFAGVAKRLLPGGVFLIDNPCQFIWEQIANGDLADGLAPDGSQQLFFLPGENRFVWRRDDQVNPDSWTPGDDDRLYRAWSLGEIALAAAGAGLAPRRLTNDSTLVVLQRDPEEGVARVDS